MSSSKYDVDIVWLHDQYNKRGQTQANIAALIGCSEGNVRRLLAKHGIKKEDRRLTYKHKRRLRLAKLGKLGENANNWKGGARRVGHHGYVTIYSPCGVEQYEHRVIAKNLLGRELMPNELVHHIDGARANNNLENLMVLLTDGHNYLHAHMGKGNYLTAAEQIEYLHSNGFEFTWLSTLKAANED